MTQLYNTQINWTQLTEKENMQIDMSDLQLDVHTFVDNEARK